MLRLGVNIDHVATLRNARGTIYPSVIEAALLAETAGADLITLHLREDRRHIRDDDVYILRQVLKTAMNLEMAVNSEMLEIALNLRPQFACLVPENRLEITTEGGLNVVDNFNLIKETIEVLEKNRVITSIFLNADKEQILAAKEAGCSAIEIHTGRYAEHFETGKHQDELNRIAEMAQFASSLDLVVNAGHGLHYHNVKPIAMLPQIHELNIGHAIIAQSIFVGLSQAVKDMKRLLIEARQC